MEGKQSFVMLTPIGPLTGVEECGAITALSFGGVPDAQQAPTPLLAELAKQLAEYFLGQRREFTLPLAPQGTPWQHRVWDALLQIPYGETRSYGAVARLAGNPKAARAVGHANNRNPIPYSDPVPSRDRRGWEPYRLCGWNGCETGASRAGGVCAKLKGKRRKT